VTVVASARETHDADSTTALLGAVVETSGLPDGSVIVIADLELPAGWNKAQTRVRFVLPVAFPSAQPDCFFADLDLRLADGNMPMNSGIQELGGVNYLWFSWHLSSWSPANDNTGTYLRFIDRRLRDAR
jgi:hypothetical protein